MKKVRVWVWVSVMALLLTGVVVYGEVGTASLGAAIAAEQDRRTALAADAMLDKLGVTQRAEVAQWLASPSMDSLAGKMVWVSKHGMTHYHSYPLCGGMRSPLEITLEEANAAGLTPCKHCWVIPSPTDGQESMGE